MNIKNTNLVTVISLNHFKSAIKRNFYGRYTLHAIVREKNTSKKRKESWSADLADLNQIKKNCFILFVILIYVLKIHNVI